MSSRSFGAYGDTDPQTSDAIAKRMEMDAFSQRRPSIWNPRNGGSAMHVDRRTAMGHDDGDVVTDSNTFSRVPFPATCMQCKENDLTCQQMCNSRNKEKPITQRFVCDYCNERALLG